MPKNNNNFNCVCEWYRCANTHFHVQHVPNSYLHIAIAI